MEIRVDEWDLDIAVAALLLLIDIWRIYIAGLNATERKQRHAEITVCLE
jgi:hypothetical protein